MSTTRQGMLFSQWNEPILIRTVDRNDILMAVLSPGETTSASTNTRYFVSAFTSNIESGDSNYLQAVSAPFRMTIPAMYVPYLSVRVFKPNGKVMGVNIEGGDPEEQTEDGFIVGYLRSHAKHLPKSLSFIFDAWVQFDLSQVPGTITSANLQWDGELLMAGPGWDKWGIFCGNRLTTFYGFPVDYAPYLLPTMDLDVTKYAFLQQQAEDIWTPVGGMTPYVFGFSMWSGVRSHYTTEFFFDSCTLKVKNVRLEVEYTK